MGGYTSKCEKKSKSLHPNVHTLHLSQEMRSVKPKKMVEIWSSQFTWKLLELYNWDQDFILSSPCSFTFTELAAHNKESLSRMC